MNSTRIMTLCTGIALLASGIALCADGNLEKRLAGHFFLPEQVRKYAEILNLSEEQKAKLTEADDSAKSKLEQLKGQQEAAIDRFEALAKQQRLDEKALLAEGDKILDVEREIKHAQLSLLVLIKNTLTPEQQTTLSSIAALDPKIREIQKAADKWKAEGRDLSKLESMKPELESQLQKGDIKAAEATLERARTLLNEPGGK